MRVRVSVTLKKGVLDPQGKAIEGALTSLGIHGVASVRQGKVFDLELLDDDAAAASKMVREACERLLANTVIEDFAFEIDARPGKGRKKPSPEPTSEMQEAAEHAEMPIEGHP